MTNNPVSGRRGGIVALVVALLAAAASVATFAPAAPRAADAPQAEFSAVRALRLVEPVVGEPRPVGSPAHARARTLLTEALSGWGWQVTVQRAVGVTDLGEPGTQPVGAVANVVARVGGSDPTGTVLLAAHYDTVAGSPGAADDGIGIAVLLELARALTAPGQDPPRNDVVILLTDGEEAGLLGAEAFVRENASALGTTVVLNHEARGAWGPPTTFRTTSPNEVLLEALSRAPGAIAESSTEAAFEAMPNATDVTHFAEAGFHAYDTAITAGSAHYHSPLDTSEHLSSASLQQMGQTSLTVTRELAGTDLTTVEDGGEDLVTTAPWGLVRYPASAEAVLAGVALLLSVVLVALRRRRHELTLPRTAFAAVAAVILLAGAGLAGYGLWQAALLVDPAQASAVTADPYRPLAYQVGVVAAALAVVLAGHALTRSRLGAHAMAAAGLVVLGGIGALLAVAAPGVSSLLVLPTLPVAAGAVVGVLLPSRRTVASSLLTLGTPTVAAVWLGPAVWLSFEIGLAGGAPVAAVLVAALVLLALPAIETAWPPPGRTAHPVLRSVTVPATVLLLAVAATATGLAVNREGATPPRQERLLYSVDGDTGRALWASWDAPRSDWSRALLTEAPAPVDAAFPTEAGSRLPHGPAPTADLTAPDVEVVSDAVRDGTRNVSLRLTSRRGAPAVGMWVEAANTTVLAATVEGRDVATNGPFGAWDFGFVVEGSSSDGVEVRLRLDQRDGPVRIRVGDRSDDLGVVPGFEPPPRGRVLVTPQVWATRAITL